MNVLLPNIREECYFDSPASKENLSLAIKRINEYYDDLKDIGENMHDIYSNGTKFSNSLKSYINKSQKLLTYFNTDMSKCYKELNNVVTEYDNKLSSILDIILNGRNKLTKIVTNERSGINKLCKEHNESNDVLNSALLKCASVNAKKEAECAEADKNCDIAWHNFRLKSMNFVEGIEKCCSYDHANKILNILWGGFGPLNGKSRCKLLTGDEYNSSENSNNNELKMEGYLFKLSNRKSSWTVGMSKWQRRWFVVQGLELMCYKPKEWLNGNGGGVFCPDLRLARAKQLEEGPDGRRWCIEMVWCDNSSDKRPQIILQADSEKEAQRWEQIINGSVKRDMGSLHRTNSVPLRLAAPNARITNRSSVASLNEMSGLQRNDNNKKYMIARIMDVAGNRCCCDCSAPNPRWASVSLGITLCAECCGVHRSLGVHISKVRSIVLDNWDPEMLAVMFFLGNERTNKIYESQLLTNQNVDNTIRRPIAADSIDIRRKWIESKWRDKKYILDLSKEENLLKIEADFSNDSNSICQVCNQSFCAIKEHILIRGLCKQNLGLVMLSLVAGVSVNTEVINGFYPIHLAVNEGFWPAVEFLILNGAQIDRQINNENNNLTSLHIACKEQDVFCVWLLLKRNAKQLKTNQSQTPLDIAIETANANTVTLLRLQALNENTKEANLGCGGDETVNNVFLDFTTQAYQELNHWLQFDDLNSTTTSSSTRSSTFFTTSTSTTTPTQTVAASSSSHFSSTSTLESL